MSAVEKDVAAGAYVKAEDWREPLGEAIPLLGVAVAAEIRGAFARVVMRQSFRNARRESVEAVYVFPAPEKAAVTGLVIETGGRRIVGRVKEKEEAFDEYDEALARGHGAVLLDQHRPNVFQASVGNLLPGQELVVELTWVMELAWEGESLRFVLPTTVAPRYAPAEDRAGVGQSEADKVNPPTALRVPYGLRFTAEVGIPGGVAGLESPSHPLRWSWHGEGAAVELSQETAAMNEDLVLLITPRWPREPWVLAERGPGGELVAAVSFLPRLGDAPRAPREVIFVVDRSGSMQGSSIAEARRALELCLRSLREGDRFDVIGFGSTYEVLFGRSRAYDQSGLDEASRHLARLDADLGGTEVLAPLRAALERAPSGVAREVILLTDGEVSNEAAVIELARHHAGTARVFTFGIGHGPSEHFVAGVARASGGAAEFIKPGERIEPKVLRQFARLGTPAVEKPRLEWNGVEVEHRAPYRLERIFDGEPFLVYLRPEGSDLGTVRLAGELCGAAVSWEVAVGAPAATEGSLVAALAARAEIRDLEEGTSRLHAGGGSQQRGRREDRVRRAIVELGVRHRLASSATSFVAVEERAGEDAQERGRLVLVPQALTRGWHGVGDPGVAAQMCCDAMPAAYERIAQGDFCCAPSMLRRAAFHRRFAAAPERQAALGDRPFPLVVRAQRADGSWRIDRHLLAALRADRDALLSLAGTLAGVADAEAVVATAAALVFLRTRAADRADEWRLLAAKGEEWLDRALAGTGHTRAELERLVAAVMP